MINGTVANGTPVVVSITWWNNNLASTAPRSRAGRTFLTAAPDAGNTVGDRYLCIDVTRAVNVGRSGAYGRGLFSVPRSDVTLGNATDAPAVAAVAAAPVVPTGAPITSATAGDRVTMLNGNMGGHGVVAGMSGTIEDAQNGYSEARVRFDGVIRTLWVNYRDLTVEDPEKQALDAYKREVVTALMEHKRINGWCGSAEMLAQVNGLGDLLPKSVTVTVPYEVVISLPAGEPAPSERDLRDRAREAVRINFHATEINPDNTYVSRGTVAVGTATNGYEDHAPTGAVEGETLVSFKERLRTTARAGATQYGVRGVDNFLRAVGIDPDVPVVEEPVTETILVTLAVTVPREADRDASAFGTDLATLLVASAGAEGVEVREAHAE